MTLKAGFLVAIALASPGAQALQARALEPYGVWFRPESGTAFDFYNCNAKLCAKVISVSNPDDKKAIGTVILRNAVRTEDGDWTGDLYNTEDGKIYSGTISVKKPTELTLEGCLLKVLCKTETWKRAPDQSSASTPNGLPVMPAPSPMPGLGH